MREIKFRAWKISEGSEMFKSIASIEWSLNRISINYPISSSTTRLDYESLDNIVLEQYTGLKDKNGVEIYENDILKSAGGNIEVVIYIDGRFEPVCWYGGKNYEVIGNVHQNADLLVNDNDRISPDEIGNDIHEFLHGGDK